MDLRKVFFFVLVVVVGLILWAFGGNDHRAAQQASGSALPTHGMVGKTVSDAAKQATTTVPSIPEDTTADQAK
ncbi:MAG: hypothetical protein LW823_02765 [Rickettsiales bacterium]|jgi:hypothetical protein|nr:hypothetical protein [Rickettsiales bacterium]